MQLAEQFSRLGIRQVELEVFADPKAGRFAAPSARAFLSRIKLDDAILAFGTHVYLLMAVEPGATIRVELSQRDRQLAGYLRQKSQNALIVQPWANRGQTIDRADLLLDLTFHESEATAAPESTISSNVLREQDLTGPLALNRPMLVARVDRPTSRPQKNPVRGRDPHSRDRV